MVEATGRLLLRSIRLSGGYGFLLAVCCVAGAGAELALPATLGRAVDAALDRSRAPRWLIVVAALVVVIATADLLTQLASGAGAARATARLRQALLRRVFALAPSTASRYPVGDLVARVVGQAADAGQAANAAVLGVASVLPSLGSLVALTLIDPWLGGTFIVGLALLTVLMRGFVADASAAATGYQRTLGAIAGRLLEAVSGARTIAAAGTVEAEIDRVLRPLSTLHRHGMATWTAVAKAAARSVLLAPLIQIAVIGVGGLLLAAGRLTPGQLFAAMQYAALGAGLGAVVATLNRLVRTRTGCQRVAEVLSEEPTPYGERELPAGPGTLALHGVVVRTGERTLLDRVELTVPGGATVAVVGGSGAGKSVLAAVAGRLRDPDEGEVLLDGVPLAELSAAELRAAIGYGFERPVLIGADLGEVIGLGHPGADDASVRAAARTAAIDGYVRRLPDGYRTRLADAPMSGGEAQRLGVARALWGQRLLVLDDASSSVDSVTEEQLGRALTRHTESRTRLVVTHRAATAARADLVAWLDRGRLRGLGPHDVLWCDPDYRAVFATGATP